MRIVVAGLHTECSTYNPVIAGADQFRVLRGEALAGDAYFAFLKDYPATFIPLLHARAIPGGPVDGAAYRAWKQEILDGLAALAPLDGVYLAMHGAMYVDGLEDAEGDFISAVREIVGPDCLIAASYDLHGNLSQRIIDVLDIFSTYRTAPHIDVEETMRRSVSMLVRALENGIRPEIVWVRVPVLLPGERTSTEDQPAKSFYARLPEVEAPEGIWDASFQVGYVWADEPRATAAAVMTGTDIEAMQAAAADLAQRYWDLREKFVFGMQVGSIDECVDWAIAAHTHPVVLAESGDNPTGGGVGDRAEVLAALIARNAQGVVFAGICDRPATDAAYAAGPGAQLDLRIGGTLDPSSAPVAVRAIVKYLLPVDAPELGEAVLTIGGIDLVVTGRRRPFHNLADFRRLGLEPEAARVVVVKSGYLSPELAPIAAPALMALSAGSVDQFVERLPRLRKPHPSFPFDRDFTFTPEVLRSRRG